MQAKNQGFQEWGLILCERQVMGMNINQFGNAFKVEKSKKLDHKALGFHSLK